MHPAIEDVELGLTHRALQAEQRAIVVGAGFADAVGITDQRIEQGTHLQKLMPISAGAGQTGDLDPEDQADMAEIDLRDETLKSWPVRTRAPKRPRTSSMITTCSRCQSN